MANTFNTGTYEEVWATKLQERLTGPTNWKEICEVVFSDTKIFNLPYMSTEYSLQSGTRGSAFSHSDFALTNDTLDISSTDIVSVFQDRADVAQSKLANAAEHGSRQGDIINERVEDLWLAQHGSWTDFGQGDLDNTSSGDTTKIGVTQSNIDDIIRAVKRTIIVAKGAKMARKHGIGFVWRPADFEKLEASIQSQGFTLADETLKRGVMMENVYFWLGAFHYVSESHSTNHVFAGVRKIQQIGLLKTTWGRIYFNPNAVNGDGPLSGVSYEARLDYGFNTKAGLTAIVYDMNVT